MIFILIQSQAIKLVVDDGRGKWMMQVWRGLDCILECKTVVFSLKKNNSREGAKRDRHPSLTLSVLALAR